MLTIIIHYINWWTFCSILSFFDKLPIVSTPITFDWLIWLIYLSYNTFIFPTNIPRLTTKFVMPGTVCDSSKGCLLKTLLSKKDIKKRQRLMCSFILQRGIWMARYQSSYFVEGSLLLRECEWQFDTGMMGKFPLSEN